jgi:hypothetical protein
MGGLKREREREEAPAPSHDDVSRSIGAALNRPPAFVVRCQNGVSSRRIFRPPGQLLRAVANAHIAANVISAKRRLCGSRRERLSTVLRCCWRALARLGREKEKPNETALSRRRRTTGRATTDLSCVSSVRG